MLRTTEVTLDEITSLTDFQLTDVLRRLLLSEARAANIPRSCVDGSLIIDIKDGGKDASINWEGGPENTNWVTRDTYIQIKATQIGPKACRAEMLNKDEDGLKPLLKELFLRNGSYVLFCNKPGQDDDKKAKIREALKDSKLPNWKKAKIDVYGPTKIMNWVNEHLGVIVAVKEYARRPLPPGFQTWERAIAQSALKLDYVTCETLEQQMQILRGAGETPRSIVRIIGQPGLGKTRRTLESFRNNDLCKQLAYFDARFNRGDLAEQLVSWSGLVAGILLVDNCGADLHRALAAEVKRLDSRLSLITIDSNPDQTSGDEIIIEVSSLPNSLIEQMLKNQYKSISATDLRRITEFAEGSPMMAVLLSESNLKQESSLNALSDMELVKRLLGDLGKQGSEGLKIIEACALFTHFGFGDDITEDLQFIADKVCQHEIEECFTLVKQFAKRGVIQITGAFARVVPKPLAWRLASNWFERRSISFVDSLSKDAWPEHLITALCEQLSYLHDTKAARKIAQKLCEPTHPFASAENLNTKWGSRIFRSITSVDPEAAATCLQQAFKDSTEEELLNVGPGRRYLIWGLENLCFWSSTFEISADMLLKFAIAENEKIGNNATKQFAKLFQLYASGTQADLDQRCVFLEEHLKNASGKARTVLLNALVHALEFSHFSRTVGVEVQGSRSEEKEYQPKGSEIPNYWRQIVKLLREFILDDSEERRSLAEEKLSGFLLAFLRYRMIPELEETINFMVTKSGKFWVEGFQQLSFALRNEGDHLTEVDKQKVQDLLKQLEPKTVEQGFEAWVSKPSYSDYDIDDEGNITPVTSTNAKSFARRCAVEWPTWKNSLPHLLSGEQRAAADFGAELISNISDVGSVLNEVVIGLESIDNDPNPELLGGMLLELKNREPVLVNDCLKQIANSNNLRKFYLWLLAKSGVDEAGLDRALALLSAGHINPASFMTLSYGGVLKHLPADQILKATKIINAAGDVGALVSLNLLFMYSYQNEERWLKIRTEVRRILLQSNLLLEIVKTESTVDINLWDQLVTKLITPTSDKELAKHVAKEIISLCGTEQTLLRCYDSLRTVVRTLLKAEHEVCWPIFGSAFISDDWRTSDNISMLLANRLELDRDTDPGAIFELPIAYLIKWCRQQGTHAQELVARHVPVFERLSGEINKFAKKMLDEFGSNSAVLRQLDLNIYSFGWVGSLVGPYKKRIAIVEKLESHKHIAVRRWAKKLLKGLKDQLRWAEKREAEQSVGIFDGWGISND